MFLTIGIPTYNRAKSLERLLKKIIFEINKNEKIKERVEIVISDNASVDNTEEIVKVIKEESEIEIRYYKNKRNFGIDKNIFNVIQKANGKYVWLLGDDETITDNSIKKILEEIYTQENIDIFILNGNEIRRNKQINLNALDINDNIFLLKDDKSLATFISKLSSLRFFFCFISSMVIKKETFLSQQIPNNLKNSVYDHLFKILSKIKYDKLKVKYLSFPFYTMGKEENEWNKVRGRHLYLDTITLYKFISYLSFSDEKQIKTELKNLLERQHPKRVFLYSFYYAKQIDKKIKIEKSFEFLGFSEKKYILYRYIVYRTKIIEFIDRIYKFKQLLKNNKYLRNK